MTVLSPETIRQRLEETRAAVDAELDRLLPPAEEYPPSIHKAMRYSVFAGGKRLRPTLCVEAGRLFGGDEKRLLRLGSALELIHTYSLIHDDLPALDNDDLRRGKPTSHVVFGEAAAILAGDALLTLAFEVMSGAEGAAADGRLRIIHELAHAIGTRCGMVGGQVDDMLSERQKPSLTKVLSIHRRKTGALLLSSVHLSALLAGVPRPKLEALTRYGWAAGLAFQIVDDLLNETSDTKAMGKKAGSDRERGKMTFPAAIGLVKSKIEVNKLTGQAVRALKPFGEKGRPLRELAIYMAQRTN